MDHGLFPRVMPQPTPTGDGGWRVCPPARRTATITVMSSGNLKASPADEPVSSLYDTRLPQLSLWRKMQIPIIAAAVISIIRVLGPTLHFEKIGQQHYDQSRAQGVPVISAFWHRCIISATWYWRNRNIVVMNTTNFDGQWTRRVIEHFGFGTAQGSSTRGGMRGLAVMAQRLEKGVDCAFTIDGPRGPRYVAKPGPVMLARRTGRPIFVFHVGLEKALTLKKAWDLMQIPHPFSRAIVVSAPLISVSPDADAEELKRKQAEMQAALERVRDTAESWFGLSETEREHLRAEWNA
jgi:lysophospholipid acyltransferase (LPLAT)-like uncharacterized protein